MSLIDEALKRARDQKPPDAAAPAPRSGRAADPWAYAPLPHARRRPRLRGWAVAALVLAIAAVSAGVWLSRSAGLPGSRGATAGAPPRPASSKPPAAVAPPAASLPAPPPAQPAAAAPSPPAAAAAAGRLGADRAAPARVPAPRREVPAEPPPRLLPQPASRAVDGRVYIGALVAPNGSRVELGGIVYSETNASALLNGRILPVGGVVEGLTVASISEDRVELTGDGLTVHLTLR